MSDEHWYRNTSWDDAIAARFDARLARSRSQKAQYLRIQGSVLKDSHPQAALGLFARCVALDDDYHTGQALLDSAHAQFRLGDVDAMLDALTAAISQERRVPHARTSAPADFCFIAALYGRAERYDQALEILAQIGSGPFPLMDFQTAAAHALILSARGREPEAADYARRALAVCREPGWVAGFPEVGAVPQSDHPVFDRLAAIANAGAAGDP